MCFATLGAIDGSGETCVTRRPDDASSLFLGAIK
jgi:hypothetical protein